MTGRYTVTCGLNKLGDGSFPVPSGLVSDMKDAGAESFFDAAADQATAQINAWRENTLMAAFKNGIHPGSVVFVRHQSDYGEANVFWREYVDFSKIRPMTPEEREHIQRLIDERAALVSRGQAW